MTTNRIQVLVSAEGYSYHPATVDRVEAVGEWLGRVFADFPGMLDPGSKSPPDNRTITITITKAIGGS